MKILEQNLRNLTTRPMSMSCRYCPEITTKHWHFYCWGLGSLQSLLNKLELIQVIKERTGLTKQESTDIVKLFFDSLTESMIKGERIEIRELCSFFIKEYAGYTGRNPKTGKKVMVPAKRLPFFKPGKELKKRVDHPN